MYKAGDHIKFTNILVMPVSPYHMFKIEKGEEYIVKKVDTTYYEIESLKNRHVIRVPLRIDGLSEKVVNENTSVENKRFDTILCDNLTFSEAMKALNQGVKVTRSIWGGFWKIQNVFTADLELDPKKSIVAYLKDGGWALASPYQEDMLADDWMIVE